MHDAGRGAARNSKRAFELVQQAAKRGHAPSQFALAGRYLNGLGVTADVETAKQWYRFAAEHGLAQAAMTLGYLHEHPRGNSDADLDAAAHWYRQAMERYLATKQPDDARAAFAAFKNVATDHAVVDRWQTYFASMPLANGVA